ncbi:MAG: hypothetical protein ABSB40_00235 [Nitrososphaeria archaeon]
MRMEVRLEVDENFQEFARKIGKSPKEVLQQLSETIWLARLPLTERLKNGVDLRASLLETYDLAELGWRIDDYIRKALELKVDEFVLDDSEVNLEDQHYFLAYSANSNSNGKVSSVYVILDKGSAELICDGCVEEKQLLSKIKAVTEDLDEHYDTFGKLDGFSELMDSDHEFNFEEEDEPPYNYSLTVNADELGYLPTVSQISKLFSKIEEIAST